MCVRARLVPVQNPTLSDSDQEQSSSVQEIHRLLHECCSEACLFYPWRYRRLQINLLGRANLYGIDRVSFVSEQKHLPSAAATQIVSHSQVRGASPLLSRAASGDLGLGHKAGPHSQSGGNKNRLEAQRHLSHMVCGINMCNNCNTVQLKYVLQILQTKIGTNAPKSCMSQSLWYNCIASNHYICILFTRPKITTKTRKKQVVICRQQYYSFSSLSIPKPSFKKVQTYLHYTSHSSVTEQMF